ncbi:UNVERIFIED_CONTAM: hypothetical protein FKN15_005714 [Acipenser sinensis]
MAAVTFIKQDIRKNDAGNYTCMYGNENPGDVKNISHGSSVYLSVQVEFRDATGEEDVFHLYKDGRLVDSQHDPKGVSGVKFSIKNVKRSDTGNYTCVYGKEKLVNSANSKHSRPVYLHVTESYGLGNDIRIFLSLGILLVLSVIVGEDFSSRKRKHQGDGISLIHMKHA